MTQPQTPAAVVVDLDLDKIEALARAATPGEWKAKRQGVIVGGPFRHYTNGSAQSQIAAFSVTFHHEAPDDEPERQQANADFCAALNPAVVLKLLALARSAAPAPASVPPVANLGHDDALSLAAIIIILRDSHPQSAAVLRGIAERLDHQIRAAQPPAKLDAAPQAESELIALAKQAGFNFTRTTTPGVELFAGNVQSHERLMHFGRLAASLPDVAMPEQVRECQKCEGFGEVGRNWCSACNGSGQVLAATPAEGSAQVASKWRGSLEQIIADLPLPEGSKQYQHGFVTAKDAVLTALRGAAPERSDTPAGLDNDTLLKLARRTLWLAYAWNDHNFDAAHKEARKTCEALGIHSFEEANTWLDRQAAASKALDAAAPAGMTNAARDVLAERRRQVEQEGWTPAHDDKYDEGELARAAACYALQGDSTIPHPTGLWPWPADWWKPTNDRRNTVKAAALLLAEIERLDRIDGDKQGAQGDGA